MLEHHIQKQIIARLVGKESARFAELRPKGIDSNVFTYHLNVLVTQKYVEKTSDGYRLTNRGKLLGINTPLTNTELLEQAHSILLLAVQDGDKWLLRKRLVQPMINKVGFVHGEPQAGKTVEASAKEIFTERTGLQAEFAVRGSGLISLWQKDSLESYTHFVLLYTDKVTGSLVKKDKWGENMWVSEDEITGQQLVPSMPKLLELLKSNQIFFVDLEYRD